MLWRESVVLDTYYVLITELANSLIRYLHSRAEGTAFKSYLLLDSYLRYYVIWNVVRAELEL